MTLSNPEWNRIETRIKEISQLVQSNRQRMFFTRIYDASAHWHRSERPRHQSPCLRCGNTRSSMMTFDRDGACNLKTPVSMCFECWRDWKTDPRTVTRRTEERSNNGNLNIVIDRPRSPEGWQLDMNDVIAEINDILSSGPYPVTKIEDKPHDQAKALLGKVTRIRDNLKKEIEMLNTMSNQ